jgi:hypothetical protein
MKALGAASGGWKALARFPTHGPSSVSLAQAPLRWWGERLLHHCRQWTGLCQGPGQSQVLQPLRAWGGHFVLQQRPATRIHVVDVFRRQGMECKSGKKINLSGQRVHR